MAGKEHLIEKNEEQLGLFPAWVVSCKVQTYSPEKQSRKVLPQILNPLPRIGLYFKDCPAKDGSSISLGVCLCNNAWEQGQGFLGADEGGSWHNRPARHIQGEIQGAQGCSRGAFRKYPRPRHEEEDYDAPHVDTEALKAGPAAASATHVVAI